MARITLNSVDKRYPNGQLAASDINIDVADGELLVLVGPSGSGKSTVLRMIAGLEIPTAGTITFADAQAARDVTKLPPQDRDVAMVFQSYALYPHMSVRENMGFGLRIRRLAATEVTKRVETVAESLGLTPYLERKPAQLSGGQRQRVALGRAIVREPVAFLFDEPLSNLDAALRTETRAELKRLHRRLGATMVYVTHDQVEAMTLGDRVAVLSEGRVQQIAPPMELYRRPANRFVAGFIGSPPMSFLTGRLRREGERCVFVRGPAEIEVPCPARTEVDGEVLMGVRPQEVTVAQPGENGRGGSAVEGVVALVEPLGSEQVVHVRVGDGQLAVMLAADVPARIDDVIALRIPESAVHLFRASDGRRVESG